MRLFFLNDVVAVSIKCRLIFLAGSLDRIVFITYMACYLVSLKVLTIFTCSHMAIVFLWSLYYLSTSLLRRTIHLLTASWSIELIFSFWTVVIYSNLFWKFIRRCKSPTRVILAFSKVEFSDFSPLQVCSFVHWSLKVATVSTSSVTLGNQLCPVGVSVVRTGCDLVCIL